MSILRSFLIQQGASQVSFTADVEEFLGIAPGPGGAFLLTRCRGFAENRPTLLGANGLALPSRQGDEWHVFVLIDGAEPPAGAQFVGGLSAHTPAGPTGVYFFVKLAVLDGMTNSPIAHLEAPDGTD